jgi:D-alanine--poly(phosphoribitol) ligase subunit 1
VVNLSKYDIGQNLERAMLSSSGANAIYIEGKIYSYKELYSYANSIRHTINNIITEGSQFIGILSYRSIDVYAGIVGILLSKNAYLALNPNHPVDKVNKIIQTSECKIILLAEEGVDLFLQLKIKHDLTLICPNPGPKLKKLIQENNKDNFIFREDFFSTSESRVDVQGDDSAYLMFTSGSTGAPKGIAVSHKNLYTYLNYTLKKYNFKESDRVSQTFDTTFDLSAHDIFVTFLSGACLYVIPKKSLMSPKSFIIEH